MNGFFSNKVPIETCSGGKRHEASSQSLLGRPVAQGELGQAAASLFVA